jgi:acyl-coenzyme A thioesterase PaaI-like protein
VSATLDRLRPVQTADRPGVEAVRRVRHRLRRRTGLVCGGLVVALLGLIVAALVVGDFPLSVGQVFA